ncbi:MAG: class I SAM-dependent methyltransferase [Proteobacteria bacterium]|nr:class I SAM-dependent methyltransferase [Pseudomonadota bacterium]
MSTDPSDSGQPLTGVSFGYERVSQQEKTRRVAGVFSSVAQRYDLMNDLMSAGTHRLMKRMMVELSSVQPGNRVLDLAGGTGDISALLAQRVGAQGQVVLADINPQMIDVGRDRLIDAGYLQVSYAQSAAEKLPFKNGSFDCATISFGLRNFTAKDQALAELNRVLRPEGVLLILEFSQPANPILETAYHAFQSFWPLMGKALVGEGDSYRYLVESIRVHPSQKALKVMIEDAGFHSVTYHNLLGGIAAIHRGLAAGRT